MKNSIEHLFDIDQIKERFKIILKCKKDKDTYNYLIMKYCEEYTIDELKEMEKTIDWNVNSNNRLISVFYSSIGILLATFFGFITLMFGLAQTINKNKNPTIESTLGAQLFYMFITIVIILFFHYAIVNFNNRKINSTYKLIRTIKYIKEENERNIK